MRAINKPFIGISWTLLVLTFHTPAAGQVTEAQVLPRGVFRVEVGGTFGSFAARFGSPAGPAGDAREPLASDFVSILTAQTYTPLQRIGDAMNQVFAATDPEEEEFRTSPETLFLRTGDIRAAADQRQVPFGIHIGVLPRIEVGIRVPLVQNWLEVRHFGILDGTIGRNPDPAHNRALLAQLNTEFGPIGGGAFLPTRESALGRTLQDRVRAATGQELRLPETPLVRAGVQGVTDPSPLQTGPYDPQRPAWNVGDAEIGVKLQLANTLPPAPERAGSYFRAAAEFALRLPTGSVPEADYLVWPVPEQGLGGVAARLHADLAASPRFGAAGGVRWESLQAIDIERPLWILTEDQAPVRDTHSVRWDPGSRIAVEARPRIHLVDELSAFLLYTHRRHLGETLTPTGHAAGGVELAQTGISVQRTAHQIGAGLQFATVDPAGAGRGTLPFVAELNLRRTVAGSGGEPAIREIELLGRFYVPMRRAR